MDAQSADSGRPKSADSITSPSPAAAPFAGAPDVSVCAWLDTVGENYGGLYAAAFAAFGVDSLRDFADMDGDDVAELLQSLTGFKPWHLKKIRKALASLQHAAKHRTQVGPASPAGHNHPDKMCVLVIFLHGTFVPCSNRWELQ